MGAFIEMVPSPATTRATADRVLRQLGRARAKSDSELGQWLLCGFRLEVHRVHGHASFREYAEWVFGFSGRSTEERLRTSGALEHLPKLSSVFEAGDLHYSVVREVSRVATPATEDEWLAAIEGKKAAEVERMVSGRERGDRPSDPVNPEAEIHRVLLKLGGSSRALLSQARDAAIRASGGTYLSDDDFVAQLARTYLAAVGTGASVDAAAPSAAEAELLSDAGLSDGDADPPSTAGAELLSDADLPDDDADPRSANSSGGADAPRCDGAARAKKKRKKRIWSKKRWTTASNGAAPTTEAALVESDDAADGRAPYQIALTVCDHCKGATQDAGGAQVLVDDLTREMAFCDAQHLGRVDGTTYQRATQTILPRIRRAVLRRHGKKCAVPGCTNRQCDVHHGDERADGGTHDPERLIVLCQAHHRATHDGRLRIRGTWSSGFQFEHADGTPYGSPKTDGERSKRFADVYDMLCSMGFRPKESRGLIDRIRPHVGAETSTEALLKLALRQANVPGVCEERAEYRRVDHPARERRAPTWGRSSSLPHPYRDIATTRAPTWGQRPAAPRPYLHRPVDTARAPTWGPKRRDATAVAAIAPSASSSPSG